MAIITNIKSKGNVLSAQTFSVRGIELKIGGQYATANQTGQVLAYNDTTKSMELISVSAISGVTTIGAPKTGNYIDDGLLPLTNDTKIGHAIDMINEVLKALAPKTAQSVKQIAIPSAIGISNAKLSFGADKNDFTPYTAPPATNRNSAYSSIKVAGSSFSLSFTINGGVIGDSKGAYPADVFSDVLAGDLVAYVNDSEVARQSLVGLNTSSSTMLSGVSFNIGAINHVLLDGQPMESAPYRTASVTFTTPHVADSNGFRKGHNSVKVVRELSGANIESSVVEFILVDATDASAVSISAPSMSTPVLTGLKLLSGVKYHTQAEYTHTASVSNMYQIVYQSDSTAISHSLTGLTVASVAISGASLSTSNSTTLPQLSASSNAASQGIGVTTVLRRTTTIYPTDSVAYSFTAKHPLKGAQASTAQTKNGLLIHADNSSATSENEDFKGETFRLKKNDYHTLPFSAIDTNSWDSSIALSSSDAGHGNGMAIWKNKLVHAKTVGDMSSFGPAGNVDYSNMTAVGTYYRKFKMNSNASMPYVVLDLVASSGTQFMTTPLAFGNGTNNELTPSGSQVAVSMMIVKSDGSKVGFFNPLVYSSSYGYNGRKYDGSGIVGGGSAVSNINSGLVVDFLAGYTISKDDYIILKIQAPSTWTGDISTLRLRYV
jgi:hypothetical protein